MIIWNKFKNKNMCKKFIKSLSWLLLIIFIHFSKMLPFIKQHFDEGLICSFRPLNSVLTKYYKFSVQKGYLYSAAFTLIFTHSHFHFIHASSITTYLCRKKLEKNISWNEDIIFSWFFPTDSSLHVKILLNLISLTLTYMISLIMFVLT